jgi:hypothetical protein
MANLDIEVYRGTTYPVIYNHLGSNGLAQSLAGCILYFTVKADKEDTDQADTSALIKKTVTSHTDEAAGVSGFTLTDVDTYVPTGRYYYDLVVEDATLGSQPPSLFGKFTVKGHPTNRNTVNG